MLIAFEVGEASRVKAVMKWWTKCISMVIAKTASRNVVFKSDKLMDALFQEGQLLHKRLKHFLMLTSKVWPATLGVYFNQDGSQE